MMRDVARHRLCFIFLVSLVIGCTTGLQEVSYQNHHVLSISLRSEDDLNVINALYGILHVWSEPVTGLKLLADVAPRNIAEIRELLENANIEFNVRTENMQEWIDEQKRDIGSYGSEFTDSSNSQLYNYTKFNVLEDIYHQLYYLDKYHPRMELVTIAQTIEQRPILAAVISATSMPNDKKSVFIECGAHAREWVAQASCMWIIRELLADSSRPLLNKYNFHVLPVLNPDGYVYSMWVDRTWRRNRKPNSNTLRGKQDICKGVDINRNFNVSFRTAGFSNDICNESFPGFTPFSECEAKFLSRYLHRLNAPLEEGGPNQLVAYFSLHSYRQLFMYPRGYTKTLIREWIELERLAKMAVDRIREVSGVEYAFGSIANTMYEASGSSVDYVFDVLGVKYSFAIELRDKGERGFIIEADQIEPTANEVWSAIQVILNEIYS